MYSVIPFDYLTPEWALFIALLIGIGFGFILEQSGFSSSRKLIGVFYGYDMLVVKVFLTAVIVGAIGLLLFNSMGWIDLARTWVAPLYLGSTILGSALIGIGMALSGFCPGTSFSAASIGKIDAMVFILGIFLGIAVFAFGYPLWDELHVANNLGQLKISDSLNLSDGVFVFVLILVAIVVYWLGEKLEKRFDRPDISKEI